MAPCLLESERLLLRAPRTATDARVHYPSTIAEQNARRAEVTNPERILAHRPMHERYSGETILKTTLPRLSLKRVCVLCTLPYRTLQHAEAVRSAPRLAGISYWLTR